jgi:hypothetical protein
MKMKKQQAWFAGKLSLPLPKIPVIPAGSFHADLTFRKTRGKFPIAFGGLPVAAG